MNITSFLPKSLQNLALMAGLGTAATGGCVNTDGINQRLSNMGATFIAQPEDIPELKPVPNPEPYEVGADANPIILTSGQEEVKDPKAISPKTTARAAAMKLAEDPAKTQH